MVMILDSTLREGEQTPGVYFDSHIKLAIADASIFPGGVGGMCDSAVFI